MSNHSTANKFGTFKGVYLPSVLTILGVIMYLRMGWVAGQAGLWSTIAIVTLASCITFVTALSISAIATNMDVKGGGAYYMISRSFGAEAGAAVGLPLFLAQVIGIGFYIAGFTESLRSLLPGIDPLWLSLGTLGLLTMLAYVSTNLALKAQILIFVLIAASLVSFFTGSTPPAGVAAPEPPHVPFWAIFAVFFPAVTGILSGVSMSGDLAAPRRSIPLGTLAAVGTGYVIYLAIPIFLIARVSAPVLQTDMMIIQHVASVPELILLGIWGATLSSALSSLLAAPRTLQALAQDRIMPAFLGQGFGRSGNPRLALGLSCMIAAGVLFAGELDSIAPVLTMFLLATYGMLNLIAAVEAFLNNPSWRPVFKMRWPVPFIGALLCLAIMLMINAGATLIAVVIIASLFYWTLRRNMNRRWDDTRHGLLLALARFSIYRLARFAPNVKSWRPNMLVLSGAPSQRFHLIELADAMTHGKGFLTVASVVRGVNPQTGRQAEIEKSLDDFLAARHIPALTEVVDTQDFFAGARELVRTYGMGPLVPNTILLGISEKPERFREFADLILTIFRSRRNVILFNERTHEAHGRRPGRMLCWWRGKENNAGLMLALSYLLQTSPEWQGAELWVKTIVEDAESAEPIRQFLRQFVAQSRMPALTDVLVNGDKHPDAIARLIHAQSRLSDLIFLGLRPPAADETPDAYAEYYAQLLTRIQGLPSTVLVLAGEDLNFKEIFE